MRATLVLLATASVLCAACSVHRQAGTGDVAFRLLWEGRSDLDLLVEDPVGECVFYANPSSPAGGVLDVDCNAGSDRICEHPIENVYWPTGTAPAGTYRLWVQAHALIPAEAPLPYRLLVLRGTRAAWRRDATLRDHLELHGPFVYTHPDGVVAAPATPRTLPPACDPWERMERERRERDRAARERGGG